MEEALRQLLITASGIAAGRVNWGANPQGAGYPALVLNVISGGEGLHMQGGDGLLRARVQVDCYAASYGEAKTKSRAVIGALHGHRGGGFRLVEHLSTRDSREGGSNEAERPFRVSMDFMANWRAEE